MSWTNSDGLTIYFGKEEAIKSPGGSYEDYTSGALVVDFLLPDLTLLTTTAADIGRFFLPAKHVITRVDVFAQVAATSGGSATLNVGMKNAKTGADIGTADVGVISAMALTAIDATGETTSLTAGSSGAGGKVGTQISSTNVPVKLTAKYGTAAFTAGAVRIKIHLQRMLTTD